MEFGFEDDAFLMGGRGFVDEERCSRDEGGFFDFTFDEGDGVTSG